MSLYTYCTTAYCKQYRPAVFLILENGAFFLPSFLPSFLILEYGAVILAPILPSSPSTFSRVPLTLSRSFSLFARLRVSTRVGTTSWTAIHGRWTISSQHSRHRARRPSPRSCTDGWTAPGRRAHDIAVCIPPYIEGVYTYYHRYRYLRLRVFPDAFPDLGDGEMHPSGRLRRTVVLVMRVYARTRSPGDNLSKTTFFT